MSLLPEPGIEPVLPVGLIAFEERDMDRCLDGSVVAITGAGRGICRQLALYCAAQGAAIIVNDPGVAQAGKGLAAFSTSTRHMRQFAAIDSFL